MKDSIVISKARQGGTTQALNEYIEREVQKKLESRNWRIENLYRVEDKDGNIVEIRHVDEKWLKMSPLRSKHSPPPAIDPLTFGILFSSPYDSVE